ncbi:type III-B CRISPR-associated protein Cas10/Cmr2 [Oleidesulfovibrio alaskensis]
MKQYIYFSFGPVVDFITQSRRTKDLWSGSYLLSWLSGQAMAAIVKELERLRKDKPRLTWSMKKTQVAALADNTLVFNSKMLAYIYDHLEQGQSAGALSIEGGIPDEFVFEAEVTQEEAVALAQTAEAAFRAEWESIATRVYDTYITGDILQLGAGTENIWQRQIAGYWDVRWVVSDVFNESLLHQRDLWKQHMPVLSQGSPCALMPNMQDISGYSRTLKKNRVSSDTFWEAVRKKATRVKGGSRYEIRTDERLCAVAFVRRMFANEKNSIVNTKNWASTPYIAAIPFLIKALEKEPAQYAEYASAAAEVLGRGVYSEQCKCVADFYGKSCDNGREFAKHLQLDGNLLQPLTYVNNALSRWSDQDFDPESLQLLAYSLDDLKKSVGANIPTHYAVLQMDGDNIGKLIESARQGVDSDRLVQQVSQFLFDFAKRVSPIVNEGMGVPIYAGGDDVLALLPLTTVFAVANKLQLAFRECFELLSGDEEYGSVIPTLSGGVVIAHFNDPLGGAIKKSSVALFAGAKQVPQKNCLVTTLFKGGEHVAQWTATWPQVQEIERFLPLIHASRQGDSLLSSSFMYRFREILQSLDPYGAVSVGSGYQIPNGFPLSELLIEAMDNDRTTSANVLEHGDTLKDISDSLLRLCGYEASATAEAKFHPDAFFLMRFLAQQIQGGM